MRRQNPGAWYSPAAWAAPGVAAKATADRATAAAIEIVFMVGLQKPGCPTVQMVSYACGYDYKKIYAGLAAPARAIAPVAARVYRD
jgi:hypothetical protein